LSTSHAILRHLALASWSHLVFIQSHVPFPLVIRSCLRAKWRICWGRENL